LLDRAQELGASLWSRLPGTSGESVATQVAAAGGSRGAGMAALAKLLTLCAGAAGGAACVATGVLPAPLLEQGHEAGARPAAVRPAARETAQSAAVEYEPVPAIEPEAVPKNEAKPHAEKHEQPSPEPTSPSESSEAPAGAIEYEPPPPPVESAPAPTSEASASSGSAAGEFGP
jgi:hypothetical protein